MAGYLEAFVMLLPSEVGGRERPVTPREGNYRPHIRAGGESLRIRFIEGPPSIAPGQDARVVVEIEDDTFEDAIVAAGKELDLIEHDRVVGIITIARMWDARPAAAEAGKIR